ncbi:MAG: hypothetical protein ACRD4Q_04320 [Candidatus Acidiferrales bacterium]
MDVELLPPGGEWKPGFEYRIEPEGVRIRYFNQYGVLRQKLFTNFVEAFAFFLRFANDMKKKGSDLN